MPTGLEYGSAMYQGDRYEFAKYKRYRCLGSTDIDSVIGTFKQIVCAEVFTRCALAIYIIK